MIAKVNAYVQWAGAPGRRSPEVHALMTPHHCPLPKNWCGSTWKNLHLYVCSELALVKKDLLTTSSQYIILWNRGIIEWFDP